jgi:predicted metal-dependent phosphoesterase TrpH
VVWVDLHLHSSASFDCKTTPESLLSRCHRLGLGPIFLTDHDTIAGARHLQATAIEEIVIGEEIMTTEGEVIGLFLQHPVEPGLTPKAAALEIKSQGGLVYLEHPYDQFRRHLSEDGIEAIADGIDIVEVFNGRSDEQANRLAEDLCVTLGATPGAGSDAHALDEIGSAYIEIDRFYGPQDFLIKLRQAKIVRRPKKLLLLGEAWYRNKMRRQ